MTYLEHCMYILISHFMTPDFNHCLETLKLLSVKLIFLKIIFTSNNYFPNKFPIYRNHFHALQRDLFLRVFP